MVSSTDRASQRLVVNADRRMWYVMGAYAAVGVVLMRVADLPVGRAGESWKAQAWMTLAYIAANAAMTVFRVDRNNALRRTNETLTEMLYVVGLFWLTPWGLIIGRIIAAFTAWHFTKMRWQWRIYNAIMYFSVSIVLVRVYLWLAPRSPLDGWRAVLVAGSVWFLNDLMRIGAFGILDRFRFERARVTMLFPPLSTSYLRLIACAFGLLIAIALEFSPWALIAVGLVGVLFVIVSKANSRVTSLDNGITQISRFSAATANADSPDQVEHELLRSVGGFGRMETVAIVTPDQQESADADAENTRVDSVRAPNDDTAEQMNPSGGGVLFGTRIAWTGRWRSGLDSTLQSTRDLVKLSSGPPQITVDRKGTVAAWSVDPIRSSYLVVESSETIADQKDLWTTAGHLVDHARLAIDTVYKSRSLTDLADREYQRARVDPLTGLPNRLAALAETSEWLSRATGETVFSLVRIELLGYQESVNLLGQDFGDSQVVTFAEHLRNLDDADYVAQIAAAQFMVLVSSGVERARRVAEVACAGPASERGSVDPFGQQVAVAGIVSSQDETTSAAELLRAAGIALDRASGDEQIVSFGATDAVSADRRMSIRFRLGQAIDERLIVPEFQPQISLDSGVVTGCEVLARWHDRELRNVGPDEFIAVAEQSGQIDRLTLTVAEQALDVARYWGDDEAFGMSINVSARSLGSPGFVRAFTQLVDGVGRPPSTTTIEITESMLVDRSTMLLALERIRELGLRISIDDFGTGYSALSYLDRLPADEVKIDQSMVRPIAPDHSVSAVVCHLIELCRALGLAVCAEGIEDLYQLNVLRSLGCDFGQGYLFSRSLDADSMATWIAAHRLAQANDSRPLPDWANVTDR